MRCYLAGRWHIQKTEETGLKELEAAVKSLDQSGDRDALLQQHDTAFCLPFRFNYHPHEGDQVKPPCQNHFNIFNTYGIAEACVLLICFLSLINGIEGENIRLTIRGKKESIALMYIFLRMLLIQY